MSDCSPTTSPVHCPFSPHDSPPPCHDSPPQLNYPSLAPPCYDTLPPSSPCLEGKDNCDGKDYKENDKDDEESQTESWSRTSSFREEGVPRQEKPKTFTCAERKFSLSSIKEDKEEDKNNYNQSCENRGNGLLLIILGIGILVGVYFAWNKVQDVYHDQTSWIGQDGFVQSLENNATEISKLFPTRNNCPLDLILCDEAIREHTSGFCCQNKKIHHLSWIPTQVIKVSFVTNLRFDPLIFTKNCFNDQCVRDTLKIFQPVPFKIWIYKTSTRYKFDDPYFNSNYDEKREGSMIGVVVLMVIGIGITCCGVGNLLGYLKIEIV